MWPDKNVDVSKLSTYLFSERISVHFCPTCSTPMFFGHPGDYSAPYGLFTGTLQNDPGNLVVFKYHMFVGDTKDGGASSWMKRVHTDGSPAKRYKEHMEKKEGREIEKVPADWPPSSSLTGYKKKLEDAIPIRCKCKGVDLVLNRAKYEDDSRWFFDRHSGKYVAGLCVCDSCRLFAGIDAFPWTFAELSHISFPEGKALPKDMAGLKELVDAGEPALGTLKRYESSSGVHRYFCSNCSATIFFFEDKRPAVVDIAIGALEASDGARAEGFLAWRFSKVTYAQDTKGGWREAFVNNVEKEMREFAKERGYPMEE